MGGKPFKGSKRIFVMFSLFCGVLLIYLTWTSNHSIVQVASYSSREVSPTVVSWTWRCINDKCQKTLASSAATPIVSLTTCKMLCGSSQIWPNPTGHMSLGSSAISFHQRQIRFEPPSATGAALVLVQMALHDFNHSITSLVPKHLRVPAASSAADIDLFAIAIAVGNSNVTRLRLNTDESYVLKVKINQRKLSVNITATTFFGARHGLETLSQLIWFDDATLKIIKGVHLTDKPMFPYRGIMIDTSRNFIPITNLKQAIEGMAANKLNVFHWHITDSQSFPLMSPRVPQMAQYGAYASDKIYTPDDVKELVHFARRKGVRVIIEIDTPAHAGNGWTWGPEHGLGELALCVNQMPWHLYCGEPPCGQLNPANPNTYEVLEKLYRDIRDLTGEDEIFHIGGDEVNLECWNYHSDATTPGSTAFANPFTLWGEFTLKALKKLELANGAPPPMIIVWSSQLTNAPYNTHYFNSSNTVVQVWGPLSWGQQFALVADNYRILASHVDAWYLDCGFGRWRETGEGACDPYRPWQTFYLHRPWRIDRQMYIGGEACLWTEQVDAGALEGRLWPRAAAFAERMWSDPDLEADPLVIRDDVYTRMVTQRERMVARGHQPEAMWPQWCSQNPGQCS